MIKLSVIVLCYHGDRWIGPCVESLENQSLDRAQYEIILVDNGGSTPLIDNYRHKEHIKIVTFDQNIGFADGNNKALAHSDADLVVLMNQDVVVHYRCLEEMLNAFAVHQPVGVIAANMQMVSTKKEVNPFAPIPRSTGIFRLTRLGYAFYELIHTDRSLLPIDFASGNGLGFRKTILGDIGNYLFDARLGSYAEDLDLTLRVAKSSWEMRLCHRAVIYHYRDDSFSGSPAAMFLKFVHVSCNRLLVYRANASIGNFLVKLPLLLIGIPFKVSRVDGRDRFDLLKFAMGILALPVVVGWFLAKLAGNPKTLLP